MHDISDLVVAIAVGLFVLGSLAWILPRRWYGKAGASELVLRRVEAVSEWRRTLLQYAGAIGVAATLTFTVREYGAIQDRAVTDRLAKAIDHLSTKAPAGSPDSTGVPISVSRLGGIIELAQIARADPGQSCDTMDILEAYIRSEARTSEKSSDYYSQDLAQRRPDIQMAMIEVARLNSRGLLCGPNKEKRRPFLTNIDVVGGGFGGLDFSGAVFDGSWVDAHFVGANLSYSTFSGSYLARANLRNANLEGVVIYFPPGGLTDVDLRGANLRYSKLTGKDLFSGIRFDDHTNLNQAEIYVSDEEGAIGIRGISEGLLSGAYCFRYTGDPVECKVLKERHSDP
jgi:hypothetical protein